MEEDRVSTPKKGSQLEGTLMIKAFIVSILTIPVACSAFAQSPAPLRFVTKIPVPGMTETWDHLTGDPAGKRLFASAQEDQTVWVFDLKNNKPIHGITAGFNRPQGLFYTPAGDLFVSNGRDGTVKVIDGRSFQLVKNIPLTLGADLMGYDPKTKYLYVDHGGKDSNRGPGGLAIIDTVKLAQVGNIITDWRPAALALEKHGPRLFVTLPGAGEIGVINRNTQKILAKYPVGAPARPDAIALDEVHRRIFVGTRTPNKFIVLDIDSGKTIAAMDSVGGIEGLFFDAAHQQIYISGLDGIVAVYRQVNSKHYISLGRVTVVPKAGTSHWMPSLNRYYVAAPPHDGQPGAIWVYEPAAK